MKTYIPYNIGLTNLGGSAPLDLILKTSCISQKNKATLVKASNGSDQKCSKEFKIPKSQFYFSRDHGCEVTVNNV